MGDSAVRILLVEDNRGDARLLREALRDAEGLPFALTDVERLDAAIKHLAKEAFDVVLLDLSLPDSQGTDTVKRLTAAASQMPVLVLTGTDDAAVGTEAVRCGAQDYLVKGQTDHRLLTRAIRYAIERKRVERERESTVEFLGLMNANVGVHDLIEASVRFFRKQSGCEAVGIRLRDGDDYPYYETHGFPEQFVRAENSLCVSCENGDVERDSAGDPVMACMCGNVICGRFDPTKPFFTQQGSFWANDTTRLLATTADADRQARTRNRCNGAGYESVALIALRSGEERLGLLQLNDRRKDMFTPETIALWERLSGYLAAALGQARAKEELRKSEEQLRVAAQAAEIGMWSWTPGTSDVTVSVNWRRLFGVGETALVTFETWRDALHPDDRERAVRELNAANDQHREFDVEYRVIWPDGSIRWITDRGRTWYDDEGRPVRMAGANVDITERKQAELDQNLATETLRVFNRGSGDVHALIGEVLGLIRESTGFDAVGLRLREGEDCPYYQQDGFSDDFLREENFLCARGGDGVVLRDAGGQPVLECTCGLVLSGRTDPTMSCFTEGGSFWTNHSPELLALPPEVDPRTNPRNRCIHVGYESVALMPVRSGEQIIGLLQLNDRRPGRFTLERIRFFEGLANNFGMALKRRQAEESLAAATLSAERAKADAETASKAKDHFLAVLSHELRNPLNPVMATVVMLQNEQRFDADTRAQLEVIHRNVELEARLIDDLLDVTRIERGKIELNRQSVELCTIIRHAAEVCLPDIEARKLEFGIDIADGPYRVHADPARLQQVFWNLIKNAVKFTPPGGCVGIRCRRNGDGFVVAEVNDSGEGIAPELLPRLFNAFEQGGRQMTRQFGGLGLGLAISKAITQMHDGTLTAQSPGKGLGATFTVRLPLLQADAAVSACPPALAATASASAVARPLRILLVEDHGDTARIMSRVLSARGHVVQSAADVATALDLAGAQAFDLLLSDLGLPDGSGLDLMRALRQKGLTLPGIALSGYGQEQDMQASREVGFAAHLTKPVDIRRLEEAMARLVG